MEKENKEEVVKKGNKGFIILLVLIIIILGALCVLMATGKIQFNSATSVETKEKNDIITSHSEGDNQSVINGNSDFDEADNTMDNTEAENKASKNTSSINSASSNMTREEVVDLWNKIRGNWARISYNDTTCVGTSIEINTYVKISKFNSDGITTWNIVSFEKISDNKYNINLISPVNLNNQMNGDSVAKYSTMVVDINNLNNKKISVQFYGGNNIEFEYVGENKILVDESTHFQYVDSGFNQDYYCKWYKENH